MKLKFSVLLIFAVLMAAMMIPSFAAEETVINSSTDLPIPDADLYGIETVLDDGTIAVVNPIYADVQAPEDLTRPEPVVGAKSKLKAKASLASSTYTAEDIMDAGAYLRDNMVNRVATITFQVPFDSQTMTLDEMRKQCYAAAFLHTGNGAEGDYLNWNLGGYYYNQYEADGYAVLSYTPTYYTTLEQEAEVTDEVNRLIAGFGFDEATTDLQKVRAIYDYLCENIVYDEETFADGNLRHTTYAALIKKSAVCQGYATAFYRLALESGLNARLVSGIGYASEGWENHGWNIVEVDGKYYYVDATWDAVQLQDNLGYTFYLKGTDEGEFPNHVAGRTKDGTATAVPEELELASTESYPLELEIIREPQDLTVTWGETPVFHIGVIGTGLTKDSYVWSTKYVDGAQGRARSAGFKMKTITAENRDHYDQASVSCVVTDAEGNTVRSKTVKLTVVDPVAELKGYTLSLNGDIAMNFYMQLSEDVLQKEDAHMHFTIPGETERVVDVPVSEAVPKNFTIDGQKVTYYKFTAGVAAKDMTQPIHAEFYYSDSYKTVDQYYKVKDYADYIQEHPESYSDKAIAMVQAMLNYGGYAQTNFNYHTDEMANADLEDTSLPELELPEEYACTTSGTLDGVTFEGTALVLRTNTIIRHYVQVAGDISNYTFKVDGKTVTPVSASGMGENWYSIDIAGVPAKQLDRFYQLTVTEKDTSDTLTVNYCAYSNIKTITDNPSSYTTASVNMMKALYVFGEKTKAYFA